jgi:hypothetical protein
MDNGGWASTIDVSLTRSRGAALMARSAGGTPFGVMLQIPHRGLFMLPLAVAKLGFKYFKINLLLMFGHLFRKPHLTALSKVEIRGLPNDWWAHQMAFILIWTECVNNAMVG